METPIPETYSTPNENDAELIKKEQIEQSKPFIQTPPTAPYPTSGRGADPTWKNVDWSPNKKGNFTPSAKPVYDRTKFEGDIIAFLKGKTGKVKLNDYLKTLFPVSPNQPANIGDSRYIRSVLDKLQSENKLKMYNNSHDKLGDTYYPNSGIQSAQYNLDTCVVEVEA